MIRQVVDFDEADFYKIATLQGGVSFSEAVVQLALLGVATRERDQEERRRMEAGETQVDFDALRAAGIKSAEYEGDDFAEALHMGLI